MVVTAHQIASPKSVMLASELDRSASSTARAAQNATSELRVFYKLVHTLLNGLSHVLEIGHTGLFLDNPHARELVAPIGQNGGNVSFALALDCVHGLDRNAMKAFTYQPVAHCMQSDVRG
jgi:hypothetical protein